MTFENYVLYSHEKHDLVYFLLMYLTYNSLRSPSLAEVPISTGIVSQCSNKNSCKSLLILIFSV